MPNTAVSLASAGGNNIFSAASGTTNTSGMWTTSLASTLAQSETITASFGAGLSVSTTVQFVAGLASKTNSALTLSPNTQVANNSNVITALLTLKDSRGNPLTGMTPIFAASGASTTVSVAPATSASGQTAAVYQTPLAQNQNALVSAAGLDLLQPMVFVAGPPTVAASSLTASPNIVAGDGASAITLVAIARDAQGNPAPNTSVNVSASGGNTTFAAPAGTTDPSGAYSTTVTSTLMQTQSLIATFAGNISEATTVTFTGPADANSSSLTANPNNQTVGPAGLITASLILRDAANNMLSGVAASWTASGSANAITTDGPTTGSGVATATFASTLAQNENAVVTAGDISLSAPMTFIAGSPNATASSLYAMPLRQVANNSNAIVATATLADAYNNPIAGQTASFGVSGSAMTVLSPPVSNALGVTQVSIRTGVIQNANVQVSIGGLSYTAAMLFTGVPAQCSLAVSPNAVTADGNTKLTLAATFFDNQNQPVPDLMVSFSSAGSARIAWPSVSISDAQGLAKVTNTSRFAGVNTFTARSGSVSCASQGNLLTRPAFCAASPNYTSTTYAVSPLPQTIIARDFDNDGNLDLAVMSQSTTSIVLLPGNANGTFLSQTMTALDGAALHFDVNDFNNDGLLDIATATTSDRAMVYLGDGAGNFVGQRRTAVGMATTGHVLASADFNRDGILDLAVTNFDSKTVSILLGTGDGNMQTMLAYATGTQNPKYITTADLNGDGITDLVIGNYNGTSVNVLMGNVQGGFQSVVSVASGSATPNGVAVGDFNGDGLQDIVVANQGNGNLAYLQGLGTGSFATLKQFGSGIYPQSIAIADLNGDSIQDILITNAKDNTVSAFIGTGTGSFNTRVTYPTGAYPRGVAAGDFNKDGKTDFVAVNVNDNTITVYLNAGCS